MQKARGQITKILPPVVSKRFQVYFTPLRGVLFTFPSRYSYTIGYLRVFSLTGWCRQLQTGFLRSRPTQVRRPQLLNRVQDYHLLWCCFPTVFRF